MQIHADPDPHPGHTLKAQKVERLLEFEEIEISGKDVEVIVNLDFFQEFGLWRREISLLKLYVIFTRV